MGSRVELLRVFQASNSNVEDDFPPWHQVSDPQVPTFRHRSNRTDCPVRSPKDRKGRSVAPQGGWKMLVVSMENGETW